MGHGKETPRQKMIGMMYLVLTALLALNVSAEILNAFILVDKSLGKTAENFNNKNASVYEKFANAMIENPVKAKPWSDKAAQVKQMSDELINYIQELKVQMVVKADGPETPYKKDGDPGELKKKDDNNIPSEVMIGTDGNAAGKVLKGKIETFRGELLKMFLAKDTTGTPEKPAAFKALKDGIESTLSTGKIKGEAGNVVEWEYANFYQLPLAGVLTMLSKIQTDVRNSEADMLGYLYNQIEAGSWKFTQVEAIVNSPTNYVLQGEKYEAQVFIAASDTTQTPKIIVGGRELPIKEGKGIYVGGTGEVGFKDWGGEIQLKSPSTGEVLRFPFKSQYQVGKPGIVVSPTKMNVFYIGVPNPVDISVSGVPSDRVKASMSGGGGSIDKKGGDEYTVKVTQTGKCYIAVAATFADGSTKSMGQKEFRIKRVPDPVAMVGNQKEGVMKKNAFVAYGRVDAVMENFDFELEFRVSEFIVSMVVKGFTREERSTSNRFSQAQIEMIQASAPGTKVYIENIKAKGPDGSSRPLGNLMFKLQ